MKILLTLFYLKGAEQGRVNGSVVITQEVTGRAQTWNKSSHGFSDKSHETVFASNNWNIIVSKNVRFVDSQTRSNTAIQPPLNLKIFQFGLNGTAMRFIYIKGG